MQISDEEILHIANLASLNLSNEEVEKYKKDLQDILNFANKASVDGIEETIIANEAYNVFRKDEIGKCYTQEELLQNAEDKQNGMFKIPKVM